MEEQKIIAIVGSHVDTVTNISNYLEGKGYKTVWAYLGMQAIPLCKSNSPRLLIMDATLAGAGAFEIAKILPEQKILVMTALTDTEQLAKQFKNIIGVISKPIDLEEVETYVKKFAK